MFSSTFYNSFLEESEITNKELFIGSKQLQTKKLSWVLDNYCNSKEIDFLTIDVEGLDFKVLKSNNWIKYRPKVIVFEPFEYDIDSIKESLINNYLKEKGYSLFCLSPTNAFYIENEFLKMRFNREPKK